MGQRTQFLVIEKKPNGETEKRLYHNQWGHGKVMFNGMMSLISALLSGCDWQDDKSLPLLRDKEFRNLHGFRDYFNGDDPMKKEYLAKEWSEVNIDSLDSVRNLYNALDNNDGGVVVEIEWYKDKDGDDDTRLRAGFILCHSRNGDGQYSKWVTPERYAEEEGGKHYMTKDFMKAFRYLCKYAEVKWMNEEEERVEP